MQAERGFRVCSDDFVSDYRETLPRYKTFLTERDNPSSSGLQTKRPHGDAEPFYLSSRGTRDLLGFYTFGDR